MQFACVDIEIVSSIVNSLDIHKAVGANGLSARFLKVFPYMVILINKCIDSSSVPCQWKQDIVTPVSKCKQYTSLSYF